jgi:hypothetical protein
MYIADNPLPKVGRYGFADAPYAVWEGYAHNRDISKCEQELRKFALNYLNIRGFPAVHASRSVSSKRKKIDGKMMHTVCVVVELHPNVIPVLRDFGLGKMSVQTGFGYLSKL